MPEKLPPGGLKPRSNQGAHDRLSPEDQDIMREIEQMAGKPESLTVLQIQATLRMAKAMEDIAAGTLDIADMLERLCGHFNIPLDDEEGGEETPPAP